MLVQRERLVWAEACVVAVGDGRGMEVRERRLERDKGKRKNKDRRG